MTAEEVAVRLRVRPTWVYFAARDGRLRSHRVGRYRRFLWEEVYEDFLNDNFGA